MRCCKDSLSLDSLKRGNNIIIHSSKIFCFILFILFYFHFNVMKKNLFL